MATTCITQTCIEVIEYLCDCTGFNSPNFGTCGTPLVIPYTLPAGATNVQATTTAPGTSITSTSNTSVTVLTSCTGTGVNISGTVTVSYSFGDQNCSCGFDISMSNPIPAFDCGNVIYLS